jgi:hypothetical protein
MGAGIIDRVVFPSYVQDQYLVVITHINETTLAWCELLCMTNIDDSSSRTFEY